MGISGFASFLLQNSESVYKSHKLRNTYLILDGNNLANVFYRRSGLSVKFGGEYNDYYKFLKSIFLNFIKCNITPIVVFDGAFNDEREEIIYQRWIAKNRALFSLKNNSLVSLSPALSVVIFKYVLEELSVNCFNSLFEADKEIATVAKLLNCPVLSQDTDFCFFHVQFVPVDYMNYEVQVDETAGLGEKYYFECLIFHRDYFKKELNLSADMFLLIPTLLGNEFCQGKIFKDFFDTFIGTTRETFKLRVQKVLTWLKEIEDFDYAVKIILSTAQNNLFERMLDIINLVRNYFQIGEKPMSPYININLTDSLISIEENIEKSMLPYPLCIFPACLIKAYIKGSIPPVFVKLGLNRDLYSGVQYEDFDEPSSDLISKPIFCGQIQVIDKILGKPEVRKLHLRIKKELRRVELYISENFLPNTVGIIEKDEKQKKRLFFEVVGFRQTEERLIDASVGDWSVFLIAVKYWMKNESTHMRPESLGLVQVGALIMTALANHAKHRIERLEESQKANNYELPQKEGESPHLLTKISNSEFLWFEEKLAEQHRELADVEYNLSIVHKFAMFQCCLREVMLLNNLLRYPFPDFNPSKFYSGTIAYNLNYRMRDALFTKNLLSDIPNIKKAFYFFLKAVNRNLDCDPV